MSQKKSFILMRDLLTTVELMTDEEAGKLLKSIINHVDGVAVKLSRDLTFAFTPIKNQLDRDMDKYDSFVDKQRKNGALGGRPKKNPKNPSLSNKTQKTQANPKNLVTDNVTVNGTATVTVNDTDNATDIKQKPLSSKLDDIPHKILDELNLKAFKQFKPVESNLKLIRARLKEGYTVDEILFVVNSKVGEWVNNPDMNKYLRPATLFNAEKFSQYAGQQGSVIPMSEKDRFYADLDEDKNKEIIEGECRAVN